MKNTFIILGTLIAVMPYVGFAGSIKDLFFLFAGLTIAIMGYLVQVAEKPTPPEPPKEDASGRPADSASPIAPGQSARTEVTPTEEEKI